MRSKQSRIAEALSLPLNSFSITFRSKNTLTQKIFLFFFEIDELEKEKKKEQKINQKKKQIVPWRIQQYSILIVNLHLTCIPPFTRRERERGGKNGIRELLLGKERGRGQIPTKFGEEFFFFFLDWFKSYLVPFSLWFFFCCYFPPVLFFFLLIFSFLFPRCWRIFPLLHSFLPILEHVFVTDKIIKVGQPKVRFFPNQHVWFIDILFLYVCVWLFVVVVVWSKTWSCSRGLHQKNIKILLFFFFSILFFFFLNHMRDPLMVDLMKCLHHVQHILSSSLES